MVIFLLPRGVLQWLSCKNGTLLPFKSQVYLREGPSDDNSSSWAKSKMTLCGNGLGKFRVNWSNVHIWPITYLTWHTWIFSRSWKKLVWVFLLKSKSSFGGEMFRFLNITLRTQPIMMVILTGIYNGNSLLPKGCCKMEIVHFSLKIR